MAEYTIDKIQYGDDIYHLQGEEAAIESTYDSTTHTVTLTVGTLTDADTTDY